jgi:hypothetical protein
MKSCYQFDKARGAGRAYGCKLQGMFSRRSLFFAALLAAALTLAHPAAAQVAPDGDKGGFSLSAGAVGSAYQIQYGQERLAGVAAVVDAGTRSRLGIEGEARWLLWHRVDNGLKVTTYSVGPRYHFTRGRLQFYGKGMAGVGEFTFPYDYAHGSYLVVTGGGGVDYLYGHRISFRLADAEYQYWPQFTFGAMDTYGISAGIRYRIF